METPHVFSLASTFSVIHLFAYVTFVCFAVNSVLGQPLYLYILPPSEAVLS